MIQSLVKAMDNSGRTRNSQISDTSNKYTIFVNCHSAYTYIQSVGEIGSMSAVLKQRYFKRRFPNQASVLLPKQNPHIFFWKLALPNVHISSLEMTGHIQKRNEKEENIIRGRRRKEFYSIQRSKSSIGRRQHYILVYLSAVSRWLNFKRHICFRIDKLRESQSLQSFSSFCYLLRVVFINFTVNNLELPRLLSQIHF